jgi:hypothetical protein
MTSWSKKETKRAAEVAFYTALPILLAILGQAIEGVL